MKDFSTYDFLFWVEKNYYPKINNTHIKGKYSVTKKQKLATYKVKWRNFLDWL